MIYSETYEELSKKGKEAHLVPKKADLAFFEKLSSIGDNGQKSGLNSEKHSGDNEVAGCKSNIIKVKEN